MAAPRDSPPTGWGKGSQRRRQSTHGRTTLFRVSAATDLGLLGLGALAAGSPVRVTGSIASCGRVMFRRIEVAAVLKAFPWDVWAAMAMSLVGVLIAVYFEQSPVLAFVLILFALCGYIVIQMRFDGRNS